MVHSIEIEVALDVIPERLHININKLRIGDQLTIADIVDLPTGAKVLDDVETMVVHCIQPMVEEEEAAPEEAGAAEPEVIGKGKEEDEEEGEAKE